MSDPLLEIVKETMPFRVAIVEDEPGVRAGLTRLFNETSGFECVNAYATGEAALAGLPTDGADVILMDINLPGLSGIECVRQLKDRHPSALVIMVTVYEDTELVFQALQAGATGYVLKRTAPAKLIEAVREVLEGGAPITSHIARKVVEAFHTRLPEKAASDIVELSPREKEVLELLAAGFLIKEIADKVGVGFGTTRTYVRRIYEKLHVRSRSQAIAKYYNSAGSTPAAKPLPRSAGS